MAASHWTLEDIAWSRFDRSKLDPEMLRIVKTAAVVERNGADYGRYLANVFADDAEFQKAAAAWAFEEEQHGRALARWAVTADPAYDADAAFRRFTALFRIPVEASKSVRGSRSGELCARCVVETGTSSFYSAIRDTTAEPVLREICARIAADEIRHYKLFFGHLQRYLAREPLSVMARLNVAFSRIAEADDDELASAYHAGTEVAGAYDRATSARAYHERALALYRRPHVDRAARLIAKAAGLAPSGWVARLIGRAMWLVISVRGRKFSAGFSGST